MVLIFDLDRNGEEESLEAKNGEVLDTELHIDAIPLSNLKLMEFSPSELREDLDFSSDKREKSVI